MPVRVYVTILLAGLLFFVGCGKKYDDFVETNTAYVDAMESYTDDLDRAQSAEDVATAMDKYSEKLDKLIPKMKALMEKYPEWTDESKIPEELKPLSKKAEGLARRMPQTFMRAMRYMQDPKVSAAMQRLQETMQKMQ